MLSTSVEAPARVQHVKIAEIKTGTTGVLKATLGSCVALGLINHKTGVCGMAHCLLATSPNGTRIDNARYVDQALPNLFRAVCGETVSRRHLTGFIAGGAHMIGHVDNNRPAVGDFNLEAARVAFKAHRILFAELATGGMRGYNVVLNCATQSFSYSYIDPMSQDSQGSSRGTDE